MWRLIVVVLAIVMVANIVDYLLYRRTMARLRRLQARLGRAADER